MTSRVASAYAATVLLTGYGALLCLGCATARPRGPLDAARLAHIAQNRAAMMLDKDGPCRDWFVSMGASDPAALMRGRDIRAISLENDGEEIVAGTPRSDTRLMFVNSGLFAGLTVESATLVLIHELTHVLTRHLSLGVQVEEAVARDAELACFGGRGDLWELDSWN